jgi:uncharacterized protein YjbI with pentapeptide repeats
VFLQQSATVVLKAAYLSQANLSQANLSDSDLSESIMFGVNLSEAILSKTNLNKATLVDTYLSEDQLNNLGVKSLAELGVSGDTQKPSTEQDSLSTIHLRILEEPLTTKDLSTIMSALTEFYTKCWLIRQGRLSDLIEYTQTHDPRFSEEASLIITKLTHDSPITIKLELGIKEIVKAFTIAFEAITQAPLRREELKLDIKRKGQKAEKERLELEKMRIEFALEEASKIVDALYPDADAKTKMIAAQTLIPDLLRLAQLGQGKGLELVLPAPKNTAEMVVIEEVVNVVEEK